jgi:hypothetical protein
MSFAPPSRGTRRDMLPAMTRTILVACLSLILPACAGGVTDPALEEAAATATRLHFKEVNDAAPAPGVDVTVTDAAQVSSLFLATISQPAIPSDLMMDCLTYGVLYNLTFTSGGATTTEVRLVPDGNCQWITLQGFDTPLVPDGDYWAQVASTIGVPEAKIYPFVPPPP